MRKRLFITYVFSQIAPCIYRKAQNILKKYSVFDVVFKYLIIFEILTYLKSCIDVTYMLRINLFCKSVKFDFIIFIVECKHSLEYQRPENVYSFLSANCNFCTYYSEHMLPKFLQRMTIIIVFELLQSSVLRFI